MKLTGGLHGRIAIVLVFLAVSVSAADPGSDRPTAGAAGVPRSQELRDLKAEISELRTSLLETQMEVAQLRRWAERADKTLAPIRNPVPPEVDRGMMIIDRRAGQGPVMHR